MRDIWFAAINFHCEPLPAKVLLTCPGPLMEVIFAFTWVETWISIEMWSTGSISTFWQIHFAFKAGAANLWSRCQWVWKVFLPPTLHTRKSSEKPSILSSKAFNPIVPDKLIHSSQCLCHKSGGSVERHVEWILLSCSSKSIYWRSLRFRKRETLVALRVGDKNFMFIQYFYEMKLLQKKPKAQTDKNVYLCFVCLLEMLFIYFHLFIFL